jgi:hypothetical protein
MSLLAQIIAGEAQHGSDADSFGVASTISNRLNSPSFSQYGSTALSQATAGGQFSAYPNGLGTPTVYQQSLADALEQNNLSAFGNTGNATYYNAPGYAYSNNGSNAYGSGSNVYSNVFGKQPTSAFQLPQMNGSTAAAAANGGDFGGGAFDGESTSGGIAYTTGNTGGGSYTTAPDGSIDISQFNTPGQSADFGDLPDNIFDGSSTSDPVGAGVGPLGNVAGGSLISAIGGGGGAPINITDLPGADTAITGAGKAVQTGAGTIGTDVQQSAGGIAGTAASIFNNAQTYFSGAVAIVALVLLGLIFVAFGLGMFKHNLAAA